MIKIIDFFRNLFSRKTTPHSQKNELDAFESAMKFIRVIEGGKFFHKNDPGGFTNMGLTQRDYPNLDLKNITRQQADDIFRKDYWEKSIAQLLPYPVYISYFDAVVNTGVTRANKLLQKALNLKQDGKIGPVTLAAIKGIKDSKEFAIKLADEKQKFYENLTKSKPKLKSFIKGWTRRTNALKEYIKTGSFSW